MRRFWKTAAAAPGPDGFGVTLDGRPVRLPGGEPLRVRGAALAEAIAAEWRDAGVEGAEVRPDDLPLTRLANTVQARIAPNREGVIEALLAYGGNDLLCYRAAEPELAGLQHESWQPWLDWAAHALDAPLIVTDAIIAVDQPRESLAALRAALAALDDYALGGLGVIVPALGSLVLALAMIAERLPPGAAHRLALLEELWQAEKWGTDEAAEERRRQVGGEIATAASFVRLARS